jgi:hypothetical protein
VCVPSVVGRAGTESSGFASLALLLMTGNEQTSGPMWNYSFLFRSEKGEVELERHEFNGDEAAESWGRELSKKHNSPIVIKRHSAHIDAWTYVDEVGETPE